MKRLLLLLILAAASLTACKKNKQDVHDYRCGYSQVTWLYPVTSHGWSYDSTFAATHGSNESIGGWAKSHFDTLRGKDTSYIMHLMNPTLNSDSIYLAYPDSVAKQSPLNISCTRL